MAEKTINGKLQQRNDTAANWLAVNPILLAGEIGIENDTGKMKIGNGSSEWVALPYLGVGLSQADILNFTYPIGSIKITTTAENPGLTLGGTWERWGNGRMLLGVDENDADFALAEQIGGEKTHTLTTEEIPAHTHTTTIPTDGSGITAREQGTTENALALGMSSDVESTSIGGGAAHNNMPPYITCYLWKRTA